MHRQNKSAGLPSSSLASLALVLVLVLSLPPLPPPFTPPLVLWRESGPAGL